MQSVILCQEAMDPADFVEELSPVSDFEDEI